MSETCYCVGCDRSYDEGRFPGVLTEDGEPLHDACAEELVVPCVPPQPTPETFTLEISFDPAEVYDAYYGIRR